MNPVSLIGPAKIIARFVEHKFPGSCTELIEGLDKMSMHPAVLKQRIDSLKSIWEDHKDDFARPEMDELSTNVGFDVSNSSAWTSNFSITDATDAVVDAVDTAAGAVDTAESVDTAGGFWDIITDLFL